MSNPPAKDITTLLSELAGAQQDYDKMRAALSDNNFSNSVVGAVRSGYAVGGSAPPIGGSGSATSVGGSIAGGAAIALLTSIAQDMRTMVTLMQSGGRVTPPGDSSRVITSPVVAAGYAQIKTDAAGHPVAPSIDGNGSYMARVAERATWGNISPHALAWDLIGHTPTGLSRLGASMFKEGSGLADAGYDLAQVAGSRAMGQAMLQRGSTMAARGTAIAESAATGALSYAAPLMGAALFLGTEYQKAWTAGTQPLHELSVQVSRATSAGQYVDAIQRGLLTQAAGMQGNLEASRSWGGMIDWVPWVGQARAQGYRQQELDIAKVQGHAESVMGRKHLAAWASPGMRGFIENQLDFQGTQQVAEALGNTLKTFGPGITNQVASIGQISQLHDMLASGITMEEIVAPVQRAQSLAFSPGGAGMRRYIDSIAVSPAITESYSKKIGAAKALRDRIAKDKLAYKDRPTASIYRRDKWDAWESEAKKLEQEAGADPSQAVSSLISSRQAEWDSDAGNREATLKNTQRTQDDIDRLNRVSGFQEAGMTAGLSTQRAMAVASKYMAQGTGYNLVNAARSEAASQSLVEASALQMQADAIGPNGNLMLKRSLNAQAEEKRGQSAQFIQANTFYQNSQESMQFGAAEQMAQIATTRGMYGPGSLQGFQSGMAGQIGAAGATAANLRQQAQRPGVDPGVRATLLAQAAQKELEQSVLLPRQTTIGTISLEDQAMEARRRSAAVSTGKAYYGGDIASFDVGIAGEIGISQQTAAQKRRQARYMAQSDPERAILESSAQEEDLRQIGLRRRSAETHFATSMSYASGLQQQAGAQMTVAQLIGGGKEAFDAATKSVEAFAVQIQAITDRLAKGGLGPEEVAAKEGEREALRTQQHAAELQRGRAYEEAAVSIAGAQSSGAKSIAAGAFSRGVGGPGAAGVTAGVMRGAENEYTKAKALLDKLGQQAQADGIPLSDSVPYQNQLAVVQAKDANRALTSVDMAASTPLSIGSRRAESAGAFNLQVLTSTYTPFGNVRGALVNQMGVYGQQLRELNTMRQQQMKDHPGEWSDENEFAFQQRRQEVGGKLIGAQQQYEQGFMDRIIAATYNAPASFKGIASQFTMREAAPFMQAMGTNWGFTDANQRDNMMFRFPRLAHSIVGMPGGEGTLAAAMAGVGGLYGTDAHTVPGGGILRGGGSLGVQTIRVIVEVQEKGTKIGVSDSTHIMSNIQNNIATITLNAVNKPGAHQ